MIFNNLSGFTFGNMLRGDSLDVNNELSSVTSG